MKLSFTDIVQLISLPLELIGLTLAILDTFFHKTHDRADNYFSNKIKIINETWIKKKLFRRLYVGTIFSLFGLMIFSHMFKKWINLTEGAFILSLWFLNSLVIFDTFSKLLPKQQLLAFAFTLMIMGFIGEIYQVINIFN